jgi:biopolymer transport protein ExbB
MKILIILTVFFLGHVYASQLDELLKQVENETMKEVHVDKKREAKFLKNLNNAKKKLEEERIALEEQKKLTKELKEKFKVQKEKIQNYNLELKNKGENLNDLFTIAKQDSKDFSSLLKGSMTSTEFPDKSKLLNKFSNSPENPTINDLYQLYKDYFAEIIASGENINYKSDIVLTTGKSGETLVTRIGLFTAFDKNGYLYYDDSIGRFVELQRQPQDKYLDFISEYYNGSSGIKPALIDPTRGVLFSMLKDRPTIEERIKQGGVIGYVILTIGFLALLFATYKYLSLIIIERNIKQQIDSDSIKDNNPLGRILKSFQKHKMKDIDAIESKLDSAIVKEIPSIQSGLPMIKLVAAVAPLLGLLGTVTGMIETFQSITLFGTGDPKLMAGGISQALMTTVLGLVVAIPVLFIYNILNSKAKEIIEILTQQSSSIIAEHLDMLQENSNDFKQFSK